MIVIGRGRGPNMSKMVNALTKEGDFQAADGIPCDFPRGD